MEIVDSGFYFFLISTEPWIVAVFAYRLCNFVKKKKIYIFIFFFSRLPLEYGIPFSKRYIVLSTICVRDLSFSTYPREISLKTKSNLEKKVKSEHNLHQ